jgi:hypothetical protein
MLETGCRFWQVLERWKHGLLLQCCLMRSLGTNADGCCYVRSDGGRTWHHHSRLTGASPALSPSAVSPPRQWLPSTAPCLYQRPPSESRTLPRQTGTCAVGRSGNRHHRPPFQNGPRSHCLLARHGLNLTAATSIAKSEGTHRKSSPAMALLTTCVTPYLTMTVLISILLKDF